MRRRLLERAVIDGLKHMLNGRDLDQLFTRTVSVVIKEDAIRQFGVPFSVTSSCINEIKGLYDDENGVTFVRFIGTKLSVAKAVIPVNQPVRDFRKHEWLVKAALGSSEVHIIFEGIRVTTSDGIKLRATEVCVVLSSSESKFVAKGFSIRMGRNVMLEKDEFELSLTGGVHGMIDSLYLSIEDGYVGVVFSLLTFLAPSLKTQDSIAFEPVLECEEDRNEMERFVAEGETTQGSGICVGLLKISVPAATFECRDIRISNRLSIGCVSMNHASDIDFQLEELMFENGLLRISKFTSNAMDPIDATAPFLTSSVGPKCTMYDIQSLRGSMEFTRLGQTNDLMNNIAVLLKQIAKETVIVTVAKLEVDLESEFHMDLQLRMSINKSGYDILYEGVTLAREKSDPVFKNMHVHISRDAVKEPVFHIGLPDVYLTYHELQLLAPILKSVRSWFIGLLLTTKTTFSTANVVLCREIGERKRRLFGLRLDDIVSTPADGMLGYAMECPVNVSGRLWNTKTATWDIIIQPMSFTVVLQRIGSDVSLMIQNWTRFIAVVSPRLIWSLNEAIKPDKKYPLVEIMNTLEREVNVTVRSERDNQSDTFTIGSGESRDMSMYGKARVVLNDFEKEFSVKHLVFPFVLAPTLVVCPESDGPTRVIKISRKTLFRNSTKTSMCLFVMDENLQSSAEFGVGCEIPLAFDREKALVSLCQWNDERERELFPLAAMPMSIPRGDTGLAISLVREGVMDIIEISSLYVVHNDLPFSVTVMLTDERYVGTFVIPPGEHNDVSFPYLKIENLRLGCCVMELEAGKWALMDNLPHDMVIQYNGVSISVTVRNGLGKQTIIRFSIDVLVVMDVDCPVQIGVGEDVLEGTISHIDGIEKRVRTTAKDNEMWMELKEERHYMPMSSAPVFFGLENETCTALHVNVTENEYGEKMYEVKSLLRIRNGLDVDLVFSVDETSFTVGAGSECVPSLANANLTYSLNVGQCDIDYTGVKFVCLMVPVSTVFRFSSDDGDLVVQLVIAIDNGQFTASFNRAVPSYPYFITNDLESDVRVFVHQSDAGIPVQIEALSTRFIAFDEPFVEGITLTIDGKKQWIAFGKSVKFMTRKFGIDASILNTPTGCRGIVLGARTVRSPPPISLTAIIACVSISFLDSSNNELFLLSVTDLATTWRDNILSLAMGSCQLDDQTSLLPQRVMAFGYGDQTRDWLQFRGIFAPDEVDVAVIIRPVEVEMNQNALSRMYGYISQFGPIWDILRDRFDVSGSVQRLRRLSIHPIAIVAKNLDTSSVSPLRVRSFTVSLASLECSGLMISGECLRYIIANHFGQLKPAFVSGFANGTYRTSSRLVMSHFHCSSLHASFVETNTFPHVIVEEHEERSNQTPSTEMRFAVNVIDYARAVKIILGGASPRLGASARSPIAYGWRLVTATDNGIAILAHVKRELQWGRMIDQLVVSEPCLRDGRRSTIAISSRYLFLYQWPDMKQLLRVRGMFIANLIVQDLSLSFMVTLNTDIPIADTIIVLNFLAQDSLEFVRQAIISCGFADRSYPAPVKF